MPSQSHADLGELIHRLNPYTNKTVPHTGRTTGEMEIHLNTPKQDGTKSTARTGQSNDDISLEMEGPYLQEWSFKGQPQKVGMAVRVKYRYPVNNEKNETLYHVEDYLLIGFQGTMGG